MSMFSPFLSPLKCHQLFWLFGTIFGYLLTDQTTADYLNCMCYEALDRTDNYYAKKFNCASRHSQDRHSILLHSGLNPAWHFWLSTRFSCCLKMKSVETILGYIQEQFYRFSRGRKPRENLWNCSRKYSKMFKTDSFLGNKKIEFKPMSGVIMLLCNRMFCCIFGQFFWVQLLVGAHLYLGPTSNLGPLLLNHF